MSQGSIANDDDIYFLGDGKQKIDISLLVVSVGAESNIIHEFGLSHPTSPGAKRKC